MSLYLGSKDRSKQTWNTGTPVAELIADRWCAMSQYGYILSEHSTKNDAIESARSYYQARPELDAQESASTILEQTFYHLYHHEPISPEQTLALFTVSELLTGIQD